MMPKPRLGLETTGSLPHEAPIGRGIAMTQTLDSNGEFRPEAMLQTIHL